MSGSTTWVNPRPSTKRRPMRIPIARRYHDSSNVPSKAASTRDAYTAHATERKSQRLHQHDHSGCVPGRTRPSSTHLRISTNTQKNAPMARLARGKIVNRKTGREKAASARDRRSNHNGKTRKGSTGSAERNTSQKTRFA